eukprot:478162-Pelagomonas_calceolata.AAC.1
MLQDVTFKGRVGIQRKGHLVSGGSLAYPTRREKSVQTCMSVYVNQGKMYQTIVKGKMVVEAARMLLPLLCAQQFRDGLFAGLTQHVCQHLKRVKSLQTPNDS